MVQNWLSCYLGFREIGFLPSMWVSCLFWLATSTIKVNGAIGTTFNLSRSIQRGCHPRPYLFILVVDVLDHVLSNPRYGVEGLTFPRSIIMEDQSFTDDIARIRKQFGEIRSILVFFFCIASGAKINQGNYVTIQASKNPRTWGNGAKKWGSIRFQKAKVYKYLKVLVGFHLLSKVNFDKLMFSFKAKLIFLTNNKLSLTRRVLVTNHVILASM